MGYYSEIAIALNRKALDKMPQDVKDAFENFSLEELMDGGAIYSSTYIKWKDDFEDVKAINDFLEGLDAENGEYYELLRIGENEEDTEHRGNVDCFSMWVDRYINTHGCGNGFGE